jgi:CelD/BcsL family acetyltransferase involved in cellulose biosynthesis
MRLEVYESSDDLDRLAPAWYRLAERSAQTPFQTFQWTKSWWSLVGRRDRRLLLHVVVVRCEGRIAAIAPFMLRTEEQERILVFATDPWADYLDVLADEDLVDAGELHQALGEHLAAGMGGSWSGVVLDEVPPWSRLTLPEAMGAVTEDASPCPRLLLDHPQTVQALREGSGEHAEKRRKLERLGRLGFVLHTEPDVIADRMPGFIAMHLRQWMCRPDRGLTFDDPDLIRCYAGMVDRLGHAGLLALAELDLDGQPLAMHLGFIYRRTFWAYRATYEVAARRWSAGHLLHQALVGELWEAGFGVLDFMRGDYEYKRGYASCTPVNRRIILKRQER